MPGGQGQRDAAIALKDTFDSSTDSSTDGSTEDAGDNDAGDAAG